MHLVIVESPTKAKTISRFLSKDYNVQSSLGHIRDLPKRELGIDIKKDFEPDYQILPDKKKIVKFLEEKAKKADQVYLATDEDREGEAISWHLTFALSLKKDKIKRIAFHEITKGAVLKALKNPRQINLNLVDAQQARRVLDRLVGYKLSPFLWRKIRKGLSAGRVQSPAVRLIVEREREREKFKAEEYWTITAILKKQGKTGEELQAQLIKIDSKTLPKMGIKNKKEAQVIVNDLQKFQYIVATIEKKEAKKYPKPPFTTSTIQQEASNKFGFSAKRTMISAQKLYEGKELAGKKSSGLITYMRTDSFNLAEKAIQEAQNFISKEYGTNYSHPVRYKTKSRSAQEAHEAIRPTSLHRTPASIKQYLTSDEYKIYDLIWRRTLASQMQPAIFDATIIDIITQASAKDAREYLLRSRGLNLKFDGFTKVYPLATEEKILPPAQEKEKLDLIKIEPLQHFTEPPPRYNEASLIKTLEKEGIGRPSTYATIISTIQSRNYVTKEEKYFKPQEIGFLVSDLLANHFPEIVDLKFTAKMEENLDKIANGKLEWRPLISEFYKPFAENLMRKDKEVKKYEEKTNKKCPKCGQGLIIKFGRFGKFYACSGFPECKHTEPLKTEEDKEMEKQVKGEKCEKCGNPMVVKHGRFGPFLACSGYPDCKNIKNIEKKTGTKCPECKKGDIIERRSKRGKIFFACNQYPKCKFALWNKPTGEKCPDCQNLIVFGKEEKRVCSSCKKEWKEEDLM